MGNLFSSSDFVSVPDTEYTPCAVMLRKMGVRLVVMALEDVVVPDTHEESKVSIEHRWVVPFYNDEQKERLALHLSRQIPDHVTLLITAMLAKGLVVVLTTKHTGQHNGQAVHSQAALEACKRGDLACGRSGYVYQGQALMNHMLFTHFGQDVSKFIRVEESTDTWKLLSSLRKEYCLEPLEIMIIDSDPQLVRRARHRHMNAILADDHRAGLQLSL